MSRAIAVVRNERRDTEKGYFIAGVARKDGKPAVEAVRPGDKLVRVDGLAVDGATRGAVFSALHGKSGTVRRLALERNGQPIQVEARTLAF